VRIGVGEWSVGQWDESASLWWVRRRRRCCERKGEEGKDWEVEEDEKIRACVCVCAKHMCVCGSILEVFVCVVCIVSRFAGVPGGDSFLFRKYFHIFHRLISLFENPLVECACGWRAYVSGCGRGRVWRREKDAEKEPRSAERVG
jgi:hypothetical protein